MIETLLQWTALAAIGAACLFLVELVAPRTTPEQRRPPRHARPAGWLGPARRPPFPPVVADDDLTDALVHVVDVVLDMHEGRAAPLNRENLAVLRERMRIEARAARAAGGLV